MCVKLLYQRHPLLALSKEQLTLHLCKRYLPSRRVRSKVTITLSHQRNKARKCIKAILSRWHGVTKPKTRPTGIKTPREASSSLRSLGQGGKVPHQRDHRPQSVKLRLLKTKMLASESVSESDHFLRKRKHMCRPTGGSLTQSFRPLALRIQTCSGSTTVI